MADAADLKSEVERRVGSNPTGGTYYIFKAQEKARKMKVGDLIKELMKFDTDKVVKIASDEDGQKELDILEIDQNHEDGGPLIV